MITSEEVWEFLITENSQNLLLKTNSNSLKVGRLANISQKYPDQYCYIDEYDLWQTCVLEEDLAYTDYYEFRKLKNGKYRIRCNICDVAALDSIYVQVNDPGHIGTDPIEQLKIMGEKLDEEYSKVIDSDDWEEALRVPIYIIGQMANEGGFNCVTALTKNKDQIDKNSGKCNFDFYRGEVLEFDYESFKVKVLFYDYGFIDWVPVERIFFMDKHFAKYNKFAFELPLDLKYCEVDREEFPNLARLIVNAATATVYLEVSDSEQFDGLAINDIIFSLSNGDEMSLSQKFIDNGLAIEKKDSNDSDNSF